MSETINASRRLEEKSKVERLKQEFFETTDFSQIELRVAAHLIEHPVVTLTLKEIEEANNAAYHGDIDGDFNYW